jgi:hypothetical protein
MFEVSRFARLFLIACLAPCGAFAQTNSYTTTLQNNSMMQSAFANQMINLGGKPTTGSGQFNPANCMPPADLQRGADGHVPAELQGDPRYQEYLRCKQGIPPSQGAPASAAQPNLPARHFPITATDFVPTRPGHPIADQAIDGMSITPEQRQQLHAQVDEAFRRVAVQFRGNNLAFAVALAYGQSVTTLNGAQMNSQQSQELVYAINDQLAQSPALATMSAQQKQDESDRLIYQSVIISMLRDSAPANPEAGLQAQEMSRVMLRQFGSNDPPAAAPRSKVLLGVALSDVSPAIAAAAGFHTRDGAFVNQVAPGSAAEKAGIKPGDILVRVGDRDIKTSHDVLDTLASMGPGQVTTMRIFRQGSESDVGVIF